ncbi:MAG TPA: porin family protein [Paludibacter sp.]|nr:porin family protein [Paludibacter sp.]
MKIKSIVTAALLALAVNLSAQVGFQAGYANVNEVTKNTSGALNGFVIGPVSGYNLMQNLDLRFGVLYNLLLKTEDGVLGTSTYSGHFVDVPVQAQYSFEVAPSLKIFAFAGPTINFGIAQQTVTKVGSGDNVVKNTVNLYDIDVNNDEKSDLSRFDIKLGLGAGARYDKFELRVGYDWGMLDMNTTDPIVLHRNQLTAAVVYHL